MGKWNQTILNQQWGAAEQSAAANAANPGGPQAAIPAVSNPFTSSTALTSGGVTAPTVAAQYGSQYGPSSTTPGQFPGNEMPPAPVPGMPGFEQIQAYYKSLQPVYEDQTKQGISSALAGAGFGGTRYGSAAAQATADVAGRYGHQMNAGINQMIQGQINSDLDRALQKYMSDQQLSGQTANARAGAMMANNQLELGRAELDHRAHQDALNWSLQYGNQGLDYYNAGQGAHQFAMNQPYQAAMWGNDIWNGQTNPLMQLGLWEQGRQDDYSRMAYEDFERNKYGMLPMLGGWAAGISAGSPGQIVQMQTSPGEPGRAQQYGDLANFLGGIFGMFGGGR